MSVPSHKPSDSDREFLQAELTRLVGQGRLDLDAYQELVDVVWATDKNSDLMQIRARYLAGPPVQHPTQPPMPLQHYQPPAPQPMQPPVPPQHPQASGIPMGGHLSQPQQFSPVPSGQPEQSTMGTIKKTGEWVVPAISRYKLKGADLHLDLRKATAAAPVVTIEVNMNMGSMTLIVPPGVHVEVQMASKNWSDFKIETSAPVPGAPRVVLTGVSRASTLKVITKSPSEPVGFWEQMFGG